MNPIDQQRAAEAWNREYPVGTPVIRYKLIKPLREPQITVTREAAWLMGGHTAMVMVMGVSGGVTLESVVPLVGVEQFILNKADFAELVQSLRDANAAIEDMCRQLNLELDVHHARRKDLVDRCLQERFPDHGGRPIA